MYAVMLKLEGKKAVVVGGGKVAYRKVSGLLQAGSVVIVISPVLHESMHALVQQQRLIWQARTFEEADVADAFVVVAATNDRAVNAQVAASCSVNQLVNIVDDPTNSSFHVPAKLSRGDLTIAVSTGGASPLFAKIVRDEIAEIYDAEYADYIAFLEQVRSYVLKLSSEDERRQNYFKESVSLKYRTSVVARDTLIQKLIAETV